MGLVEELSPTMTGKQRRHLRGLAHDLNPVVLVGQKGVTDGLVEQVSAQLMAHELIKVKVHDADEMDEVARKLHAATGAALVQSIGKNLIFFKAHPDEPVICLPE